MTRDLRYRILPTVTFFTSALACAQSSVRFACVGDYGREAAVQSVADFIASMNPDFVVTVGDNNYTPNDTSTRAWDLEIGQYYGQFIRYPAGSTSAYAPGCSVNRFFPALGNHDWDAGMSGWQNYFELPGNERYYDIMQGPVHLFFIDSDGREPDGNTSSSVQGVWLQQRLASSTAPWKIVLLHHPPYSSSSTHGNTPALQWPFAAWGASLVIAGHDHTYERILKNGFPYVVNGLGGRPLYAFRETPEEGSLVRYNENYGAAFITATPSRLTLTVYSIAQVLIDSVSLTASDTIRLPSTFRLEQNFPNPFNSRTTIAFSLVRAVRVRLTVFDELGRASAILVDAMRNPGRHEIEFNTRTLASGPYFYRLEADGLSETRRLLLLK
jgi:hypothetical protein